MTYIFNVFYFCLSFKLYFIWSVCLSRQQDLFRVLKAYTVYRPDEGYCQAQAPIAAVLLMHMPAEVQCIIKLFAMLILVHILIRSSCNA